MSLPKFKSLDDVPEAFRESYVEKDGEWVFALPEPDVTKADLDALKSALDKEREERKAEAKARKEAEQKLKDQEREADKKAAGVDDDKLKELESKIRADIQREVDELLKSKDAEIESLKPLEGKLRGVLLDNKVKGVMLEAGVRPDRVDALFRLTHEEYDLTEGEKPMLRNHPTKALKVYMEDNLKKAYPEFFKGTQGSGGGAGGFQGGTPSGGTTADDVLSNPAAAATAARAASGQ